MDYTLHILLLSFAVCAGAYQSYEPYGVILQPRAGGGPRGAAALPADLLDEYEPYAYAAMPMPAMQILHVMTPPQPKPQPVRRRRRPTPRPIVPEPVYSEEQSYEQEAADDATVLVYARPNHHGGYTYRRPAALPAVAHATAPAHIPPFVVRIHKYRLNADR